MTEAGFIRISMNPLVVTEHVSARAALELLDLYKARYSHIFWQDDLSLSDALGSTLALTGHRQVTDAYLLALAALHRGVLVTLDSPWHNLVKRTIAQGGRPKPRTFYIQHVKSGIKKIDADYKGQEAYGCVMDIKSMVRAKFPLYTLAA